MPLTAPIVFRDRSDAGVRLAALLATMPALCGARPVVVGLPRGGVPVAAEVARRLHAPLDVIVVRKLGVPSQPELAVGAIGEGGIRVLSEEVRRSAGVRSDELEAVEARERATLDRMVRELRGGRRGVPLRDRTVVIVDDGVATGSTARAACLVARAHGASRVILAAPVIPASTQASLGDVADEIACVEAPEPFFSIGQWYDDFTQTSDEEVAALLSAAATAAPDDTEVPFEVDLGTGAVLPGILAVPRGAPGIVVFAHGSGSSRLSPRNQAVAARLREAGLGTLLFDLLTSSESQQRSMVFDVDLLAERLASATAQVEKLAPGLPIGYFGASTGAAAALRAAARPTAPVAAVVSRGGRPDLAGASLQAVRSPTLLVVGSLDVEVLELNRLALGALRCERELVVVDGATHLFEEPGTLDRVAGLAADWFSRHLRGPHGAG